MTGSHITGSVEQVQAILASSLPVLDQQPISTPRLTCTPTPAPRKALVSRACRRACAARPHARRFEPRARCMSSRRMRAGGRMVVREP